MSLVSDQHPAPGKPLGGTELIYNNLCRALPELTKQVQIILSRPEQYALEDKPRILWLQDLPEDPASAPLRDKSYRTHFNRIVFVSFWQQQQYQRVLGIPFHEGIVIKNAVPLMQPNWDEKKRCCERDHDYDGKCDRHQKPKLRFIYTSTPHRGLAVLAAAAEKLAEERQDWELHVYSSLKIYGWHDADQQFQPLYDKLKQNPCVIYHGTQPNSTVRRALQNAHVFVYPSIYPETSCMAIQEAMMAGCLTITSSLGALIETCGDWAWMMQFTENPEALVEMTLNNMRIALEHYWEDYLQAMLRAQSDYYQTFYNFDARVPRWRATLERVIKEGTPVEKFILG